MGADGCGSSGSSPDSGTDSGGSGSGVGGAVTVNPKITGAVITAQDANGNTITLVGNATTDANGEYSVEIPADATYPVVLCFTNGTVEPDDGSDSYAHNGTVKTIIQGNSYTEVHASTLTTIAVTIFDALDDAYSEYQGDPAAKAARAKEIVEGRLAWLGGSFDIFQTPPKGFDDDNGVDTVDYKVANKFIKEFVEDQCSVNATTSSKEFSQVVAGIALDWVDGDWDNQVPSGAENVDQDAAQGRTKLQTVFTDTGTLFKNTLKTITPESLGIDWADVKQEVEAEAQKKGVTIDELSTASKSLKYAEPDITAVKDTLKTDDAEGNKKKFNLPSRISIVSENDKPVDRPSLIERVLNFLGPAEAHAVSVDDITNESADYFTDEVEVYVEERSSDSLSIINEILCMVKQTGFAEMANKGLYTALIDEEQCMGDRDDAGEAGSKSQDKTSGSTRIEYIPWTVNSTQPVKDGPITVSIWFQETDEEEDDDCQDCGGDDIHDMMNFRIKAYIEKGVDKDYPFGKFTINFKQLMRHDNGTVQETPMLGNGTFKAGVQSGKAILSFGNIMAFNGTEDNMHLEEFISLERSPDGSAGKGSTKLYEAGSFGNHTFEEDHAFDFVFDQNRFLREDQDGTKTCLSRKNFSETVWRYGLYSFTGRRVDIVSGFPLRTADNKHGWAGYWGMWFPEETQIKNNDTVYLDDYNDETNDQAFKVFKAKGKLKKHVKEALTLGEMRNVPLQFHRCSDYSDESTCYEYRLRWNGSAFAIDAQLKKDNGTQGEEEMLWQQPDSETLDLTSFDHDELHLWSPEGGGNIRIKLSCTGNYPSLSCSASNDSKVSFFRERLVYPGEAVPDTMVCLEQCPKPAVNGTQPWDDTVQNYQDLAPQSATKVSYTFDETNYALQQNSQTIDYTKYSPGQDEQFWGMHSGPLFEATAANLKALECQWDGQSQGNTTCGWRSWDLDEFYTWESGRNKWNRFTALKKSGSSEFLRFDPPLQVVLKRKVDDVVGNYNLEYAGFGNLHGIPGHCVDWDTGKEEECDDSSRWVPEFSIADGTEVCKGQYDGNNCVGTPYLVKGLEKARQMKSSDQACSDMTAEAYPLPDLSQWQDPNIGPAPEVKDAPKVVGGIVQELE